MKYFTIKIENEYMGNITLRGSITTHNYEEALEFLQTRKEDEE